MSTSAGIVPWFGRGVTVGYARSEEGGVAPTERGRCPTHDLALSPAGDCVLCRRTFAPPPPPESQMPSPPGRSVLRTSLGVVLLCVSAVAVRALVRELGPAPLEPTRSRSAYEPLASPAPAEAPRVAEAPPPEPARPPRARSRRAAVEPVEAEPVGGGPARPTAPVRIAPAPDEEGSASGEPPGLAVARRRVSITMYSASWCGSCSRAREYLREHRIRYTERDIDDGERNRERLRELNPAGSIPTFDIEDRVLVGFGPASLEATITAAAYEILGRR